MGYQTTIIILNDAEHEIERDENFQKNLHQAIIQFPLGRRSRIDVPIGYHANACQVIAQEHADVMELIAVGGNSGRVIGRGSCYNSNHTLLRRLAAEHGYRLVRIPKGEKVSTCEDCQAGGVDGTCYDCGAILNDKGLCPKDPTRHRR